MWGRGRRPQWETGGWKTTHVLDGRGVGGRDEEIGTRTSVEGATEWTEVDGMDVKVVDLSVKGGGDVHSKSVDSRK